MLAFIALPLLMAAMVGATYSLAYVLEDRINGQASKADTARPAISTL